MALRCTKALTHQLRIVLTELQQQSSAAGYATSEMLAFGRRYAAEMYLCAQQLRDQATQQSPAAPSAEGESADDVRAELQRVLWAACIWELCMTVFVGRPALLTDELVRWWNLHLDDRKLTEQELPALEALDAPESRPSYWRTLRQLAARGLPELSLRLLRRHSALRSGGGGGGGGAEGDEQVLLERLETLLELMPRLVEPGLLQPQDEDAPLGQPEHAALGEFKDQHRVWSADLDALARDADSAPPALASAREVAATARLLSGDDAAISAHCDSWHARLIAIILYQQPTTLRWQLAQVLDRCLPPGGRGRLDPFESVLVHILNDDPYGTLKAVRAAYGDGWLIAHLWDTLWRAGAVGVDSMPGSSLDVRSFLMLQHARALGSCPSLWQLSALYASDLLYPAAPVAPSDANSLPPPRASRASLGGGGGATMMMGGGGGGGGILMGGGGARLSTLASANAAAADAARAWLRELVASQPMPLHSVKLRKLLALCEAHNLPSEAHALLGRAASAKRQARQAAAPPAQAPATRSAFARMEEAAAHGGGAATEATGPTTPGFVATALSSNPAAVSPLLSLAGQALEEALEAAAAQAASTASAAGASADGRATAELRAMLRGEGMGGMGQYYAGPRWLPPYFALLGLIANPGGGGGGGGGAGSAGAAGAAGAAAASVAAGQARNIIVELASARGDCVGDSLPDSVLYALMRFVGGLTRHTSAHAPMLLPGAAKGGDAGGAGGGATYSVQQTHVLLRAYESLRASVLNSAPSEGADSRSYALPEAERRLSLALAQSLAAAVLYEAAAPSRGSCWGAGLGVL